MIEAIKEGAHIVRTGARLRMPLKTKCRMLFESKSLQRAVKERAMRSTHGIGQRRLIHRKTVILACDEDAAGIKVLHRMIGAVVAELHLQRARAGSQTEELVPETDAEHRNVGRQKVAQRAHRVV